MLNSVLAVVGAFMCGLGANELRSPDKDKDQRFRRPMFGAVLAVGLLMEIVGQAQVIPGPACGISVANDLRTYRDWYEKQVPHALGCALTAAVTGSGQEEPFETRRKPVMPGCGLAGARASGSGVATPCVRGGVTPI